MSEQMRRLLGRTAALALVASVPVALWLLVAGPLVDLVREREAEIEGLADRLAGQRMLIARRPELERREQALRTRLAMEDGFWTGASAAAVAAAIQDRLRAVVQAADGAVRSASQPRGTAEDGFTAMRLQFRIAGSLDTLQRTLAAIETARPALFVESLVVTSAGGRATDPTPPLLEMDLEVTFYLAAGLS